MLLDANNSRCLAHKLQAHFTNCVHIDFTGQAVPANDTEIWKYALVHNFIIVTNDDDFKDMGIIKGFPPKVVLLQTGSQSSNLSAALLIKHKDDIMRWLTHWSMGFWK